MASPRGTPFPPGHKQAPGGAREGAGRKPDWFKERCRQILEETKALDFLASVIRGDEIKPHISMTGDVALVPPDLEDRMKAIDRIKEWGHGKTPLPVRATDEDGEDIGGVILLPVQSSGKAGTILGKKK